VVRRGGTHAAEAVLVEIVQHAAPAIGERAHACAVSFIAARTSVTSLATAQTRTAPGSRSPP
jgi:hypothetical protein